MKIKSLLPTRFQTVAIFCVLMLAAATMYGQPDTLIQEIYAPQLNDQSPPRQSYYSFKVKGKWGVMDAHKNVLVPAVVSLYANGFNAENMSLSGWGYGIQYTVERKQGIFNLSYPYHIPPIYD